MIKFSKSSALLTLLTLPLLSQAQAASNWTQQPNWASQEPSSQRRVSLKGSSDRAPSPFTPGSNNIALDVGQVFLMGDLGSSYSDAIGSQLHYTYGVSDMFGFDGSLGYSNHADGKFSMTTLLTGLRTNLAWYDKVIPYAVIGMGFYRPDYKITQNYSISPVLFGIHLGPGVSLELTKQLFFGASLTFHDIFGGDRSTPQGVQTVGGTYTSFYLNAGVSF